jgi:hypothetical protein
VIDKSGAGAGFLRELRFPHANLHFIYFSTIIFIITRGWHNRPGVAAVPIASQSRIKKKRKKSYMPEVLRVNSRCDNNNFSSPNPSSRTMALGSIQLMIGMGTRNLPGGKGRPECKAENLTAICEPIAYCDVLPKSLKAGISEAALFTRQRTGRTVTTQRNSATQLVGSFSVATELQSIRGDEKVIVNKYT